MSAPTLTILVPSSENQVSCLKSSHFPQQSFFPAVNQFIVSSFSMFTACNNSALKCSSFSDYELFIRVRSTGAGANAAIKDEKYDKGT